MKSFNLTIFSSVITMLLIGDMCLSEAQYAKIISEEPRLDNPNKMKLPTGLANLDSKLNFLIAETDNFYGVKSFEDKKLGFKLYDKACNLMWNKKFEDRKFDYLDVKISATGKIVIFILGKAVDLGPYFRGIEIYEKSLLSGYKKRGNVEFVSFSRDLIIDENKKQIFVTGYFPNIKVSKDLVLACVALDGNIIWKNKSPIEGSDVSLCSSISYENFLLVTDLSNPIAEIATLIDRYGAEVGKIQKEPHLKAILSNDGNRIVISNNKSISLFSTKPFKELINVKIDELPGFENSNSVVSIGISDKGDLIILAANIQDKDKAIIKLGIIDASGNKLSDFYLPNQISSVTNIQFDHRNSLKILSPEKIWRVSLEN